jgi:outer membrane immunogenic protein
MRTFKLTKLAFATAMLSPIILVSESIVSEAAEALPPRANYTLLPQLYNWTGLYAGVHAGGGFADLGVGDNGTGFIGGGQVGYNYQVNQWVVGLEAEISGSGINNNLAMFGPVTASFNWNSLSTLSSRFGYAFDNWLVYGKAGGAWADVSASASAFGRQFVAAGGTASGWVAGVGAEYAFRNNWSAKVEYNLLGFGSDSSTFISGNSVTVQTVKAGVNYRFGGLPF